MVDQMEDTGRSPSEPGDYATLKAYGHSPAKAAEIVLDAKRGDYFCERYIAFVRQVVAASETPKGYTQ